MVTERSIDLHDAGRGLDGVEVVKRGSLQGDWSQQYRRMLRSYDRLHGFAEGRTPTEDSDEAVDALFHFPGRLPPQRLDQKLRRAPARSVERLFDREMGVEAMQMCADLCNGTKHFILTRPRAGATFNSHSIAVRPAPASSGLSPQPALHTWTVRFDHDGTSNATDAMDLARRCVAAWNAWLTERDLRPDT